MNDMRIPVLDPSAKWYEDWPYGTSTLVRVQAHITGADAEVAVNSFLETLHHELGSTFYSGGYSVESNGFDGEFILLLASAGEDGFDSVEFATEDLVSVLQQFDGDVRLAWTEISAAKASD